MVNSSKGKLQTLNQRLDFQEISRRGRQVRPCGWLVLAYRRNNMRYSRYGWTIPRYVGIAVIRNRYRRWCREFFRQSPEAVNGLYDVNIIFRRADKGFYRNVRQKEFFKVLLRALRQVEKQNLADH